MDLQKWIEAGLIIRITELANHIPAGERRHVAMIAFDGQVRSSVYRFLKKWREAGIQKLIVWTDFDRAAIFMLNKLHRLGFEQFEVILRKQPG